MNRLTHKQAQRYIRADLDGLLTDAQRLDLETHLRDCEACRLDSESFSTLTARLQTEFHSRWDAQDGPSKQVMTNVQSQSRRIHMQKRIDFAFNIFGGVVTLLVLLFVITSIISQFQKKATTVNETQTNVPASASQVEHLLAFTSEMDGNAEIYTVHPDGSGQTNLTNNPARDANPLWTPDGRRIVFESDRTGISQIYVMNTDGSNVVQITNDNAEHQLLHTGDDRFNLWSSDGSRFLFLQKDPDSGMKSLFSMDITGENKILLASDTRNLDNFSYSPSREYVGYVLWDKVQPDGFVPHPYIVNASGSNPQELSKYLSPNEHSFIPYFWALDGRSIIFPAGVSGADHLTIYQLDLQTKVTSTIMTTTASLYDWYGGIVVGLDYWHGGYTLYDSNRDTSPLFWQRSDGTRAEIDFLNGADPANCYISKARSLQGNLAIGSYCKRDGKISLYWANMDGSQIQPLPDVEVPVLDGGLTALTLSPDEKFLTFNFGSKDVSSLYIWDMEAALKDPLSHPIKLPVSNQDQLYIPSWQPIVEDLTETELTPEPEKTASDNRLIAFISEQGDNAEIYTVHADGTGLTNITNNPARDDNPFWSPDGKQIAFESDRNGHVHIFLMNPDGSNVIQLTSDEADQRFVNYVIGFNPWSPDGSRLVFSETPPGEEQRKLYVMDVSGENKRPLVNEANRYSAISWSPDGQHIALLADDPQSLGGDRLYVVKADGSDLKEITKSLQPGEQLSTSPYWSQDGQSIFFVAVFQKTDPYWTAYEARLDDNSLISHATTNNPMSGWWNDISLVSDFSGMSPLKWVHSNETIGTLEPYESCQQFDASQSGTYITRSYSNGNWVIVAYCPNGDHWVYWANSDGTVIQQLLNSPISDNGGFFVNVVWSPDDKFIAFNINSTDQNDLYILNIEETLKDSSLQPLKMTNSFSPSWQPVISEDITETQPTPQPEKISTNAGLIVFTRVEGDNADIYTIRADGTDLKQLTKNPWYDGHPTWSPDGMYIAFQSIMDQGVDIYTMEPDGSNVHPLTTEPGYDGFMNWSPDGQKIVYKSSPTGNPNIGELYVMNADGSNKIKISEGQDSPGFLSWSPASDKIVYMEQKLSNSDVTDTVLYIINVDGTNRREFSTGGFVDFIVWEDNEYFLVSGFNNEADQAKWLLERIDAKDGAITELAAHNVPIVAIFEHTYAIEDQDALRWLAFKGEPIPLSPWNFTTTCKNLDSDPSMVDTYHTVSPDRKHAFVSMACGETVQFYLENEDGSEIKQLASGLTFAGQIVFPAWSSDGKHILLTVEDNQGHRDLYVLNLEEALQNPDAQPLRLTNEGLTIQDASWQPIP